MTANLINRLLPALAFASLPTLTLAGWLLRNYAVAGSLFGERAPARIAFATSVGEALAHLVVWGLIIGVCIAVGWVASRLTSGLIIRLSSERRETP